MSRFVSTGSARGLSPRGRGNPTLVRAAKALNGSIPAWAGQPSRAPVICSDFSVYPRVGGATAQAQTPTNIETGLSPRGRGNHRELRQPHERRRSIPAWAGQPGRRCGPAPTTWVYPRVGGATAVRQSVLLTDSGLSPRGRGNRPDGAVAALCLGSIPAWAGQPRREGRLDGYFSVYPRVGGATGQHRCRACGRQGLSPRGRGNLPGPVGCPSAGRSIPAWAGQPTRHGTSSNMVKVYPRVGGATSSRTPTATGISGLSPRGRGNRTAWPTVRIHARSIPAWAGQPLAKLAVGGLLGVYPRVGGATC